MYRVTRGILRTALADWEGASQSSAIREATR